MQTTRRGDPAILRNFRAPQADVPGGLLSERDFQVWIDWLVRDGQLKPGQVSAAALFDNQWNPYLRSGS